MDKITITATDRVFVLTGAGISAESGLATFRASDGLWAGHRIEDVCTPEALENNPWLVWKFYSERRASCAEAQPNPAHIALAELESKLGDRFFLCTQNVDDLHERAGSVRLVHMHGELAKSRCEDECGRPPVDDRAVYSSLDEVTRCACGARLRPHIFFFGEMPYDMPRIEREIGKASVMLVIGTSGSVYPAANFVNWARQSGRAHGLHRPRAPIKRPAFSQIVEGKAGEVMPGLFVVK